MSEQTQGKGKPTPKRSEATKRRGGPVPPPPANRREAHRQLREREALERKAGGSKAGNRSGPVNEGRMLPRDLGPVRRLVRDVVDSRRNLGWLLLPVALLQFTVGFTRNPSLLAVSTGILLATVVGVAMDLVLLGGQIRRTLRQAFPQEAKVRGHIVYGAMRSTQFRRIRAPRPQVARGTKI